MLGVRPVLIRVRCLPLYLRLYLIHCTDPSGPNHLVLKLEAPKILRTRSHLLLRAPTPSLFLRDPVLPPTQDQSVAKTGAGGGLSVWVTRPFLLTAKTNVSPAAVEGVRQRPHKNHGG